MKDPGRGLSVLKVIRMYLTIVWAVPGYGRIVVTGSSQALPTLPPCPGQFLQELGYRLHRPARGRTSLYDPRASIVKVLHSLSDCQDAMNRPSSKSNPMNGCGKWTPQ